MSEQIEPVKEEHIPKFEELATTTRPSEPAAGGFSDVASLKKGAPKVYDSMMEMMAREICREAKRGSDRIKAAMREGEDRS